MCVVARIEQLLGLGFRRDLLARADALHELRQTDRLEETVGLVRTTITSSSLLLTADEFAEARRRALALQHVLERQGLVQSLPEVMRFRAELECLAGDWDLAARSRDGGDALAEQTGRMETRADLLYPRAFVAAHRIGKRRRASWHSRGSVPPRPGATIATSCGTSPSWDSSSCRSTTSRCRARALERAADVARTAGFVEPNWLRFHGDLIEALIGLGRIDEAAALVNSLEEQGRTTSYPWTLATAARCRGLLQAAAGDLDAAAATLQEAFALGEQLGNPFEVARVRLDLGRTYRRARHRVEARDSLTEALACFDEMGATRWADTTRRELARISGRRVDEPGALTEAERRIAELVATGSSNKDVAATLFVTVHTVEGALTRIYRKLGVRSRTQLAARLGERSDP